MDPVRPGDVLDSLDLVRDTYVEQRIHADAGNVSAEASLVGVVKCFSDNRRFMSSAHDVLMMDKGRTDGVQLGWMFTLIVPGQEHGLTSGRVIRVDPRSSFVKLKKIYQFVQIGARARLSPSFM